MNNPEVAISGRVLLEKANYMYNKTENLRNLGGINLNVILNVI
jgi:hypothetical protein